MEFATLMMFAAGFATAYWLAHCHRPASPKKTVVKTTSVVLLLVAAWMAGGPPLLLLALGLCALGDALLSLEGEGAFMAGVGAFAAGHVAYILLFLTYPGAELARVGTWPGPALLLALAVLGAVMAVLLWPRAGALRWPVMAYIPLILFMGVAARALPSAMPGVYWPALFFIASDVVLALEMFVLRDGRLKRIAPFVVWPLYWLAQAGFVLAFTG